MELETRPSIESEVDSSLEMTELELLWWTALTMKVLGPFLWPVEMVLRLEREDEAIGTNGSFLRRNSFFFLW